jgi:hypothetical protein
MQACTFSQRQGYIRLTLDEGVAHELAPSGDVPGNFRNASGQPVYRVKGLGDQGLIFRFPDQSIYVYWDTAALTRQHETNGFTAPFSTANYDATTRLPCRLLGEAQGRSCPAGILRMQQGQASIVVQGVAGDTFTLNFLTNYVNATNRAVVAKRLGDEWVVVIDGREEYRVPMAAIEGG